MSKTLAFALAATLGLSGAAFAAPATQGAATPPVAGKAAADPTMPATPATSAVPATSPVAADPAVPPAPPAAGTPATPPSTGTSTDTAATASASATVNTGMSVKDNTGVLIGEVSSVKDGVATIKMGTDTFTVDTNKLGVQGGAATINATQADIRGMLKKK